MNATERRSVAVKAKKILARLRFVVRALLLEKNDSTACRLAVELRREASRLVDLARMMARKPDGLCDAQGCYEEAGFVHRVETPNVSPASPNVLTLCARHSELSRFPLLRETETKETL